MFAWWYEARERHHTNSSEYTVKYSVSSQREDLFVYFHGPIKAVEQTVKDFVYGVAPGTRFISLNELTRFDNPPLHKEFYAKKDNAEFVLAFSLYHGAFTESDIEQICLYLQKKFGNLDPFNRMGRGYQNQTYSPWKLKDNPDQIYYDSAAYVQAIVDKVKTGRSTLSADVKAYCAPYHAHFSTSTQNEKSINEEVSVTSNSLFKPDSNVTAEFIIKQDMLKVEAALHALYTAYHGVPCDYFKLGASGPSRNIAEHKLEKWGNWFENESTRPLHIINFADYQAKNSARNMWRFKVDVAKLEKEQVILLYSAELEAGTRKHFLHLNLVDLEGKELTIDQMNCIDISHFTEYGVIQQKEVINLLRQYYLLQQELNNLQVSQEQSVNQVLPRCVTQ